MAGLKYSEDKTRAKVFEAAYLHAPEVARRLRKGLSVRDAAGACGVSPSTVQKVKKTMK